MNHRTSILRRRDLRAYVAAFISYIMLAGQVAPLALAAAPRHVPAPAAAPASSSKAAAAPAALAFAAPNIVATKQDSWDDTGTPDGKAEPGQVVTYTVTVSNTGDADATNVQFNDSVDANTTLVPGSVDVQAVTTNDAYNVIGNVRIQPNAAQGLLANDNPFGGTVSGPTTTAQGGNLTVNSDGSFSYNPPPGFTGTDSFTYTVTSAGGKTDTATAELKVGDGNGGTAGPAIWFVNASAPAGGDGRLTNPYNCFRGTSVPAVQTCFSDSAPDDPGDAIFIFSGSYTSGYALLAGEKLFGQGMTVTLAAAAAVTVPAYSDALPTTGGANPVLSSGSLTDNIVVSAGNNTIRGVTLANSGGVAGDSSDISGSNFGTLTVAEVELNGTGRALNLSNGTLAAAFTGITVTASTGQGLSLATVGGTLTTAGGTTVSGNLAQCILVNTSTADINFGNTSCAGGTDGVSLQNNSAGTRTFGTLTRSGGSGVGFLHANGGGAVNVTGATSITNTAGTGVSIANSNANISFAATSVDKGANAGACVSITSNATRTTTFLSLDLNSTNASGVGLFSTTGGTINVTNAAGSEITAPQLIDINVATLGLNFNLLSSTNGPAATPALRVIGAGGSLNSGSTTVQNPGSSGLSLDGNSAAFSFGNTAVIASAATGVFLNNNSGGVTFADLDIAPDSSQPALHATNNAGAITTSSGDVDATGSVALDITGASAAARTPLALALTRVESTDSASASGGVNLNFVSGSLSVSNPSGVDTNVSNPNSFGIRVRNSTGTLNFGDTSVAGSGGTGVILGTSGSAPEGGNTGGVTFADLDITPDSGQRALLSQQSTGTITTTSGTVSTTNNVAVEIAGQAAGTRTPLNVQWTSVSALASGGNPANGIILTNTSAAGSPGGFRVLGTGGTCTFSTPTCTGGRITSTAGAEDGTPEDNAGIGVRLNSADQVFLTRMRIDNHANFAVAGKNVVGFNLDASLIDGANGTNAAFDEGAIQFRELTGTSAAGTASSITNSFIGGGREFLIDVRNFAGGTLDRLTISNNTVGDLDGAGAGFGLHVSDGDDAIHLEGFGSTATFRATVSNNVVNSARGDLVNFNVGTTGNNITSDFVMRGNTLANTHTAVLSGGGGSTITMGGGATINSTYDISCNRITGSKGFGLLVAKTLGSGTAQGTIFNNRIGTPGVAGSASSEAAGMDVDSRGSGTHTVLIKNNVVTDWGAN
ncbi:MAG TPA: cadherin-like domain-containing protein, partial [Pyrinomonadaceae bacterium]